MKKLSILFIAASIIMFFTKCTNTSADKLCNNMETRGKIISELVNNPDYMNEVMDSIIQNFYERKMLSENHKMMRSMMEGEVMMKMMLCDSSFQNRMINRCNNDSFMCNIRMAKTKGKCNKDKVKNKMMLGSRKEHQIG